MPDQWEQVAADAVRVHGAAQHADELGPLLGLLAREGHKTFIEVGSWNGGSLYAWSQLPGPPRVLSVDIESQPIGGWHGADYIRGDSHDPATFRAVQDWLDGQPADFLFIDGDHSWWGAMSDFFLYGSLVRPGGLIGLHDISQDIGPAAIWDVVWMARDRVERVAEWRARPASMGVGVLRRA